MANSRLSKIGKRHTLFRAVRCPRRATLTVDCVDWVRAADPAYHRELAETLASASGGVSVHCSDEAQSLARLVGSMLRVCAPDSPRWFRAGVPDVLQKARCDEITGLISLTNHTPLDVVSSHSAYCYRAHKGVAVTPLAPPRSRPPPH